MDYRVTQLETTAFYKVNNQGPLPNTILQQPKFSIEANWDSFVCVQKQEALRRTPGPKSSYWKSINCFHPNLILGLAHRKDLTTLILSDKYVGVELECNYTTFIAAG